MDHETFNKIYEDYAKQVYRFLLNLSGNPDVAEELTQETFVRAYLGLDSFRGDCRLYVWLCQIGKNLYYNYLKKERRHSTTNELVHILPDGRNVEEEVLGARAAEELVQAVLKLPEPYQSVLVYRVFSQLSYQEIGRILLKSDTWVRVTYYRAKTKLQFMLKEGTDNEM